MTRLKYGNMVVSIDSDSMHGANYRKPNGQPYTRKEYIKGKPQLKIAKFFGGQLGDYEYCVQLCVNEKTQIRHSALEAARITANKALEQAAGENGFFLKLRVYPHVLLRENKMIATAGADRLQEGMRHAFGKAVDRAVRTKPGQRILEAYVNKQHLATAQKALHNACVKLPATPNVRTIHLREKEKQKSPS